MVTAEKQIKVEKDRTGYMKKYGLEYYRKNSKKISDRKKKYYLENKERIDKNNKEWQLENKEVFKEYQKRYFSNPRNAERQRQISRKWYSSQDKTVYRTNKRLWENNKRNNDIQFRIKKNLRLRVIQAFNKYSTTGKIRKAKDYGIDYEKILKHLEKSKPLDFDKDKYEIDHIIPCCLFDLTNHEQAKQCFSFDNHQWLSIDDHKIKSIDDTKKFLELKNSNNLDGYGLMMRYKYLKKNSDIAPDELQNIINGLPSDFFKNNLEFSTIEKSYDGKVIVKSKMIDKLGFFPTSLWKPDKDITKQLKNIVSDTSQSRKVLNSNTNHRRSGVNGGKASIFNPHLAQMILSGYCSPNSKIYDPFGGGGTRGFISTKMGHDYTGIELRNEEVDRVKSMFDKWGINFNMKVDDSRKYIPLESSFDFSFTCPPYYDMEHYSKIDGDLSNYETYDVFLNELKKVVKNTYQCLKKGSFSVWVVGNFRDKHGNLKHFNGDFVKIAESVGFNLWDEIIWAGASNVALTRCGNFESNRKCVRMHEYIIILKK